jgi:serine/threonine protein kinase
MFIEFCPAGSVSDIMKLTRSFMKEPEIAAVCKATLNGLQYLHERRKIHRDIKAGNILLNLKGEAKLADFGVAGQLSDTVAKRNTVIGTPFWMAPEIIQEVGYGVEADIWSLGITCIEMAEGKPPYYNIHPMRAIFIIPTRPPPTLENPNKFSKEFNAFIAHCLTKNPAQRPSASDLLKNPFIQAAPGNNVLIEKVSRSSEMIAQGELSKDNDDDDDDGEEVEDEDSVNPKVTNH